MPRNGSSVYSLPAGNPVIPGTTIATAWANSTLTDIATALTQSLSTDGSTASVSLSGKTLTGGTFSGPTVTGTMTLTGGAIQFPAVQIASANANTLDDYEEGTFTPTLTFGTPGNLNVVYSVRLGHYTKIGDMVAINARVTTSTFTHTTASGNTTISGLPFTCLAVSAGRWALGAAYMAGAIYSANNTLCGAYAVQNTTTINFDASNFTTGTISTTSAANHATGTTQDWCVGGTYKTAT
jgi:hypothetical protein